jgi:Arc/MetJ-type ribon-helix-helix transcriptional regulator
VPPERPRPRFEPLTVNMPPSLRADLHAIADRTFVSLSDVVRQACVSEIERRRSLGELDSEHAGR